MEWHLNICFLNLGRNKIKQQAFDKCANILTRKYYFIHFFFSISSKTKRLDSVFLIITEKTCLSGELMENLTACVVLLKMGLGCVQLEQRLIASKSFHFWTFQSFFIFSYFYCFFPFFPEKQLINNTGITHILQLSTFYINSLLII